MIVFHELMENRSRTCSAISGNEHLDAFRDEKCKIELNALSIAINHFNFSLFSQTFFFLSFVFGKMILFIKFTLKHFLVTEISVVL